jgi:hypothetical protein
MQEFALKNKIFMKFLVNIGMVTALNTPKMGQNMTGLVEKSIILQIARLECSLPFKQ